jgi:phospho-2-dehydro-3-deoxyheptonate aldolase
VLEQQSQLHRQLVSGLSMPIGFKNGTDGNIDICGDAINSAKHKHCFMGINNDGNACIIKTNGNFSCHTILRGGKNAPNYRTNNIDIIDSNYGLSFINSLRPVQYTWDKRVLTKNDAKFNNNGKKRLGFIAQELKDAMDNNDNEIIDLIYESNPDRLEVKYGNLIPILTKAIQDLSNKVEKLEKYIQFNSI